MFGDIDRVASVSCDAHVDDAGASRLGALNHGCYTARQVSFGEDSVARYLALGASCCDSTTETRTGRSVQCLLNMEGNVGEEVRHT